MPMLELACSRWFKGGGRWRRSVGQETASRAWNRLNPGDHQALSGCGRREGWRVHLDASGGAEARGFTTTSRRSATGFARRAVVVMTGEAHRGGQDERCALESTLAGTRFSPRSLGLVVIVIVGVQRGHRLLPAPHAGSACAQDPRRHHGAAARGAHKGRQRPTMHARADGARQPGHAVPHGALDRRPRPFGFTGLQVQACAAPWCVRDVTLRRHRRWHGRWLRSSWRHTQGRPRPASPAA